VFTICDSTQHIILIVPTERVYHITNLMDFRFMDKGEEHVTVVIYKTHLALTRHIYLVQFHLNYISRVLDLLGLRFTRDYVKQSNNF
jgi:hypothetical protein